MFLAKKSNDKDKRLRGRSRGKSDGKKELKFIFGGFDFSVAKTRKSTLERKNSRRKVKTRIKRRCKKKKIKKKITKEDKPRKPKLIQDTEPRMLLKKIKCSEDLPKLQTFKILDFQQKKLTELEERKKKPKKLKKERKEEEYKDNPDDDLQQNWWNEYEHDVLDFLDKKKDITQDHPPAPKIPKLLNKKKFLKFMIESDFPLPKRVMVVYEDFQIFEKNLKFLFERNRRTSFRKLRERIIFYDKM